jgi:hypothetical protein
MTGVVFVAIALWGSVFGYLVEYAAEARRAARVHRAQ